jgi:hypothetical protein
MRWNRCWSRRAPVDRANSEDWLLSASPTAPFRPDCEASQGKGYHNKRCGTGVAPHRQEDSQKHDSAYEPASGKPSHVTLQGVGPGRAKSSADAFSVLRGLL